MSITVSNLMTEHRVFPRLMAVFIGYMFYDFHTWFTSVPVTEMDQWSMVGYATVLGAVVGLVKFYMETGNKDK